jgi:uncharacterized membrane protein YbaN (DUF454 family)
MNIRKKLWFVSGILLLGLAYIGVIMPGIPFSIPLVGATYCFAKSSKKMHDWLYNHKHFGPFLVNFKDKKIFPTKAKYGMVAMMSSSLAIMWFTTYNVKACIYAGIFMAAGAIWSWRMPGSEEEWARKNKLKMEKDDE